MFEDILLDHSGNGDEPLALARFEHILFQL